MRVADAGGDDLVVPGQFLIQVKGQVFPCLPGRAHIVIRIDGAQVQQVDRVIEHALQVYAAAALRVKPRKGPQRYNQVPVQTDKSFIDVLKAGNQAELAVQGTCISLQLDMMRTARLGASAQQHIAVVHVDALHGLPIHKQQELRVFPVVPFVNLGANIQPQRPPLEALGYSDVRAEPVMLIRPVPVHAEAVEVFKWRGIGQGVRGMDKIALFVLPPA